MELEFIRWLRSQVSQHACLRVGPGDDAAVLAWSGRKDAVVTVDLLTEGVDFLLEEVSPELIGRKGLAVNLSDLAAMAARPVAAVVALALPRKNGMALAKGIFQGILQLANQYAITIAGGDTNSWDGPLVISITAIGEVTAQGPLRRSGAKPGDALLVTGEFGGSILSRQFRFEPRVNEALFLHQHFQLHAGIDCSDGLSRDLTHIAQESNCGVELWTHKIPISPAAHELASKQHSGQSALDHALGDGEDFELILAVPAEDARRILATQPLDVSVAQIGKFTKEPGLWQLDRDGARQPLIPHGYEHRLDT